jgi:NADH:ubiquinone oxidoreductase subunit 5 (subunit L)/multisubunit Na+/H+ antiporter MnhA subunit
MSSETICRAIVMIPAATVLLLSLLWLTGVHLSERLLGRLTKSVYAVLMLAVLVLTVQVRNSGAGSVAGAEGTWFSAGHYRFELMLKADALSLPFAGLTVVLAGIVAAFSIRYLHRDPGYFRFFLLMHLFTLGALMVFLAGSLDLLMAGWELVGITSVLLVGFFQYRRDPVRNALRVFATYRVADLHMLLAIFLAHHWLGSADWDAVLSGAAGLSGGQAALLAGLLVLAAAGKSSQGPFFGWLPRAMEGPTPSSAIFYGAISVHAGAYLLLRAEPLLRASFPAAALVMAIGLGTAFLGTLVHRTCADAKTSLAYASQTQLGLIFAEIGMGWTTLATVHIMGHAMVRTLQFLRAPSMLHDYHRVHAAAGGQLAPTGGLYKSLVPAGMQHWLYRFALGRGFYDAVIDRFVIAPVQWLGRLLGRCEAGGADTAGAAGSLPVNPN